MILSAIVIAADHLQYLPYLPIMTVTVYVAMATGILVRKKNIFYSP